MSRRPRMLMLSPELPWPETTGGLVRIAALCNQMARHFDVTFVAPRRPDQVLPAGTSIRFLGPLIRDTRKLKTVAALMNPTRPFHVSFYSRSDIARLVRQELIAHRYDVIFGHFIYSLEYLDNSDVPVVIDQQNVDRMYWQNKADHSPFPLNLLSAWNTWKTIRFENSRLSIIRAYVSVSEEDRKQTRAYAAPQVEHFWVAPNGVDTSRFVPAGKPKVVAEEVVLGYLGSMNLQMNVEAVDRFCRELLPRVRRELQGIAVRFVVIGSQPAPVIRGLASSTPGMVLSGTVPDVVPWLQELDMLVCPLRIGAGTKLKVAEAMSCGLPVVGSTLALVGIPGRSGEHYIRADSDDPFVNAVCRLARSGHERAAMGRRARELACRTLDWNAIGDKLADDIHRTLVSHSVARV